MKEQPYGIIYMTVNLVNGKKYIGQSMKQKPSYLGSGVLLKKDIELFGKENFIRETICECNSQEELDEMEIFFIKKYDATNNNEFYNIAYGGHVPMTGQKHSAETREKFKKRKYSKETREKMSKAQRGEKNHFFGKTHSEETRKKISESAKGRVHNEETRKKMSEASKGRIVSEETRKKLSDISKGKYVSEETRKKISEASKGRVHNEETRKKMSESAKKHWKENNRKKYLWYTNGIDNLRLSEFTNPPEGYYRGRVLKQVD